MGLKALFHRKRSKKSDSSPTNSPGSPHPHQELQQVFMKFDVNGDGKISSGELGSIMSSLGHQPTEEELDTMIKEFDADGDGFIDFQEFVALNTQGLDTNEVMENLKDAFSVYDMNGDGSISADELHKVMEKLGESCSMAECRGMIRGVDSDGDGRIDFKEFKVMMMMMGSRWDSGSSPVNGSLATGRQ